MLDPPQGLRVGAARPDVLGGRARPVRLLTLGTLRRDRREDPAGRRRVGQVPDHLGGDEVDAASVGAEPVADRAWIALRAGLGRYVAFRLTPSRERPLAHAPSSRLPARATGAACLLLLAALATPRAAHAYIDPGTGAMAVQMLIAAVAAVGTALTLGWTRIKAMFTRKPPPLPSDQPDAERKRGEG